LAIPSIHLAELHVADAVVDVLEPDLGWLKPRRDRAESGKERALVVPALHQRMDRLAVGTDGSDHDLAGVIANDPRLLLRNCSALDGGGIRVARIVHPECIVLHAIAVLVNVLRDRRLRTQCRRQNEPDLALLEEITRPVSHAGLGPTVGDELKAERAAIEMTRLLRVADVELDIVGSVDRKRVVRGLSGGQGLRCHAIVLLGAASVSHRKFRSQI
jgi:hypothetical protein